MLHSAVYLLLDQQLVQVTESGSSVGMERLVLERSLNFLLDHGLQNSTRVTDRHLSIEAFCVTLTQISIIMSGFGVAPRVVSYLSWYSSDSLL